MSIEHFVVKKNERIYSQDDPSACFYMVLRGIVDLYEKQQFGLIISKSIYEGCFFGYEAYFEHRNQDKISVASVDSLILAIDKESINELYNQYPNCKDHLKVVLGSMLEVPALEIFTPLDQSHLDFLFIREIDCPICQKQFKVNHPRYTKLKPQNIHEDFRRVYRHFDDLWYQIWQCPHCGYMNFYDKFHHLNYKQEKLLYESLPRTRQTIFKYTKSSIEEVITEYEAMFKFAELYKMSHMTIARIWQSIAWLYEDLDNQEKVTALHEKLKETLEDTWQDSDTLKSDVELKVAYKVALLYEKEHDYEQAIQFLYKAVETREANKMLKHKASDKLYTLLDAYRKEKETQKMQAQKNQ